MTKQTEALKLALEALKHRLVKIHDALCNDLGDSGPYIDEDLTDEEICEEMPVFWAAKEIADLIGNAPWSQYTTTPQRKPLTDDEIVEAVREADLDWQVGWTLDEHEPNRFTTLTRAIEAAHGIKGDA